MNQTTDETPETIESRPEQVEQAEAVTLEYSASEEEIRSGAAILEEPKNGSFISALQLFVTWVNNLISGKKD